MRLSLLLIIPVVVTILIISLVPLPSYDSARQINVNMAMRILDTGTPEIELSSNWTTPGYWSHMNAFWTGSVRSNSPSGNYSWHLQVLGGQMSAGEPEWTSNWYYDYSIRGAYWVNVTYSFEGEVGDSYSFIITLHYDLPVGEGEVEGIHVVSYLDVRV